MVTVPTELANAIDVSDTRAKLDAVAKKLIKHRIILAEILKECVEEFEGYDVKYIENNCFAGEVQVNEISVDQDVLDADSTIIGSDTEDNSNNEGLVRYDLVFDALVPKTTKAIRLVINIEIQVDTKTPYSLVTRGVYYVARLISRQKGTVFDHSNYNKIQKVYSIWICPSPSGDNINSIAEYGLKPTKMIGQVDEPIENYDKMKIVIISLNDKGIEGDNSIIRLLSTLLSITETVENRKRILENEFSIPMTKEIEEEVNEMCNLGMAVELNGEKRGIAIGRKQEKEQLSLEHIRNMTHKLNLTTQQAMDILNIPKEEQAHYTSILDSEK